MNNKLNQSVSPKDAVREALMHIGTSVEIINHFLLHFLGDAKDTEGAARSLYSFIQANGELNSEHRLKIAPCIGYAMIATLDEVIDQGWDLQSALCTLEFFAGRLDIEYGIWVDNEPVQHNNPLFPVPSEVQHYFERLNEKIDAIRRATKPAPERLMEAILNPKDYPMQPTPIDPEFERLFGKDENPPAVPSSDLLPGESHHIEED